MFKRPSVRTVLKCDLGKGGGGLNGVMVGRRDRGHHGTQTVLDGSREGCAMGTHHPLDKLFHPPIRSDAVAEDLLGHRGGSGAAYGNESGKKTAISSS